MLEVEARICNGSATNLKQANDGVLIICIISFIVVVDELEGFLSLREGLCGVALDNREHFELDFDIRKLLVLLLNLILLAAEI